MTTAELFGCVVLGIPMLLLTFCACDMWLGGHVQQKLDKLIGKWLDDKEHDNE